MAVDEKLIARINELAKKKKTTGLTPAEQKEQKKLRQDYLKAFRGNFKSVLDNVDVVDKLQLENSKYKYEDVKEKLANIDAIKDIKVTDTYMEVLYDYKNIQKEQILELLK